MTDTWTAIVCGGTLLFALVGLILLGLKRRSEEKEFALDGPQDFDDEPGSRTFSCTQPGCNICAWFDRLECGDTPLVGFKRNDMAKLRTTLGVHDDGKPVESMRPLDVWPQPVGDPNREVEQADDRGTPLQPQTDDEYFRQIPEQWKGTP